jgi:hypothetical protein
MAARRDDIGTDPAFVIMEISLGLDLPHEVMKHPAIVSLNRDTTDMVLLWNVSINISAMLRQILIKS